MARFTNDNAGLIFHWESGIYGGIGSGGSIWPGYVQSHTITETQNIIQTRFLNQGNRNVGTFSAGPLGVEGTITLLPQNWMLLGFALGSIATTSGTAQSSNYRYDMTEVNGGQRANAFTSGFFNPWISLQIQENRRGSTANQNSVRTMKGVVVNGYTLNVNQGEPVSVDVTFLAQVGSWFSGTADTATAETNRPYLWSDAKFQISPDLAGGAVVTQESVKSFTFNLNNNFVGPNYINGSRVIQVPYPLNRDYSIEVTQDLDSVTVGSLYNVLYQGGSLFNALLDLDYSSTIIGSRRLLLTFSGCKMTEMNVPVQVGGISELSYTFVPGSVSAVAHDRVVRYTVF